MHRFANEWEAEASLKLRHGDATALDAYVERHRIVAAPSDEDAIEIAIQLWDGFDADGQSLAVFAGRNETVNQINAAIQQHRISTGAIAGKHMMKARHHGVGVGDQIVARQNDRALRTDRGNWVRNRDTFTVIAINISGITATGPTGTIKFGTDYVKEHIELGYAQTSHASQGRTVDHSLLIIAEGDTPDRAGVYVPMTRGRKSNRVIGSIGTPNPKHSQAVDMVAEALERRWIDMPSIGELGSTAVEQRTRAKELLAHIVTMAKRNDVRVRNRTHPLHKARAKRLIERNDAGSRELVAVNERDHAAMRLRRATGPRRGNGDLGMDL